MFWKKRNQGVFDSFSEEAICALGHARRIAADDLGHGYLGTEHMLLGVLYEEQSQAVQLIRKLGVSPVDVRAELEKLQQPMPEPWDGKTPFTPRAKRVIELAREQGWNEIGTAELLHALLLEGFGIAAQALNNQGITLEKVQL